MQKRAKVDTEFKARTRKSNRNVWLMRVPTALADSWLRGVASGSTVGALRVPADGRGTIALECRMPNGTTVQPTLRQPHLGNPSKVFTLSEGAAAAASAAAAAAASSSSDARVADFIGSVTMKFEAQVPTADVLRMHARQRTTVDETGALDREVDTLYRDLRQEGRKRDAERRRQDEARTEAWRTRMDPAQLLERVAQLFEHQPAWSLRDLVSETGQAKLRVRETLEKIAVFDAKGEGKGMWRLKFGGAVPASSSQPPAGAQ